MYAVVSRCKTEPEHRQSLLSSAKKDPKAPNPRGANGVKGYYVVDIGPGEWATIALFDNENSADRWQKQVRDFAKSTGIKKVRSIKAASGPVIHSVTN